MMDNFCERCGRHPVECGHEPDEAMVDTFSDHDAITPEPSAKLLDRDKYLEDGRRAWGIKTSGQLLKMMRDVPGDEDGEKALAAIVSFSSRSIDRKNADPFEEMLAIQLLGLHNATVDCLARASVPDQYPESRKYNLGAATKLTRAFAATLDALNKHQGKGGQQKVEVKHVHVHEGGQAIVGIVESQGGGGDQTKKRDQVHEDTSDVRRQDAERNALSAITDEERPVPQSWRQVDGRAEGEPKCVEARDIFGG